MSNEVYFRVKVTAVNTREFIFASILLNELEEKIEVNKIKKSDITAIHMSQINPNGVKPKKSSYHFTVE